MRLISAIWMALLASLFLAAGADADPFKDCNSENDDRVISGCTSVLKKQKLDTKNRALVLSRRGDAYLRKGNPEAALADLQACLALTPNDKFCSDKATRARCFKALYITQDPDSAQTQCAFLSNSKEEDQQALYYIGMGRAYSKNYKFGSGSADPNLGKALDALSRGIAIKSKIGKVVAEDYITRGLAYLQNMKPGETVVSQDADKALQDFNMAISLIPNMADYYLYRGYAHNQLFDGEAAWADFQKAKELAPSDPEIQDAYEKQRRIFSSEGRKEFLGGPEKQLGGDERVKDDAFNYAPNAFTCTATVRQIIKEIDGTTTLVVHLKDGCGIEPITVSSSLPSDCAVGKRVSARGTLIDEEMLFLPVQRLVDVTEIKCQ